jgi:hypothetical protein
MTLVIDWTAEMAFRRFRLAKPIIPRKVISKQMTTPTSLLFPVLRNGTHLIDHHARRKVNLKTKEIYFQKMKWNVHR